MIYSPDGKKKAYVRLTADHDALDVANKVCFLLNITCSYFRYSLGVLIMNCVDRLVSSKLCSVIFRLPFRIGLQCLAAPPYHVFPSHLHSFTICMRTSMLQDIRQDMLLGCLCICIVTETSAQLRIRGWI